jgi:hypothetical protein
MHNNFWLTIIFIEIVLYLLLALYIHKTRRAIIRVDAFEIQRNFRWVKHISCLLLVLTYFSFVAKFFTHHKDHKVHHNHFCGITYVSMALITILVVCVHRFQDTMEMAKQMPVPIEVIDDRFQMVDKLGKATALFVILSKSIALGVKHHVVENAVRSMSPHSM